MASTNETPILKLPQFLNSDKPAWVGDINPAFLKIDAAVGDNIGKISSVETVANDAKSVADSASATATALGSEVSRIAGEQDAQGSEIDSLQNDVQTLQGQIGSLGAISYEPWKFKASPASTIALEYGGILRCGKYIFLTSTRIFTPTSAYKIATRSNNELYQVLSMDGNPFNAPSVTFPEVGQTASLGEFLGADVINTQGSGGFPSLTSVYLQGGLQLTYFSNLNKTVGTILSNGLSGTSLYINNWMRLEKGSNYNWEIIKEPW